MQNKKRKAMKLNKSNTKNKKLTREKVEDKVI